MAKDVLVPFNLPVKSTSVTGSVTLDRSKGEHQKLTLSGNVTSMAVTGWPPSGQFGRLVLEITNLGNSNITGWPAGTIWPGNSRPTITKGSGRKDVIILFTSDGGTTIFGSVAGQDYR